MDREGKQESSVPAQSRVSIVTLAQLAVYWKGQGYEIRTISQLVSWSMDLLKDILSNNKQIGIDPSIAEAATYMMDNKLYQRGMYDRSRQKLSAAIRFEGMRQDGGHPMQSPNPQDRVAYKMMHRAPNQFTGAPSTVEPFMGKVKASGFDLEKAVEIANNTPEGDHSLFHELSGMTTMMDNERDINNSMPKPALPPLNVKKNSRENIEAHIKEADERSMAEMEALRNLDYASLAANAKKEV